ncbi:hypothetical protein [Planomonospora venezuelensis]|uniref:Uncharacterized protein n=1 Tax=Planomonospora venezuelensis TaxID=1999 RepID=A0A841D979_PLAVE|nr:hypothetical protein [Planomonospora venezuelensis]MBB5965044.1 hypothetical protein [Planomonospora venezuelensis]GIN05040.1 hypothetical protein Pve01_66980 [Planomonospora venezuelensis]
MSQFGADQTRIIQDLIRRVEKLEAAQRSGPGMTIGQASSEFTLPDVGAPATPSGGAVLYSSAGSLRWKDSSGTDRSLIFQQAAAVDDPDAITALTAPASYNQSHSQSIVTDLNNLQDKVTEILVALRNADHMLG